MEAARAFVEKRAADVHRGVAGWKVEGEAIRAAQDVATDYTDWAQIRVCAAVEGDAYLTEFSHAAGDVSRL